MHRIPKRQKEPTKRILTHFNVFEVPTILTIKREGSNERSRKPIENRIEGEAYSRDEDVIKNV